jgi:hypothetical protein
LRRERPLNVRLAEIEPGLAQVFRVRAQHGDFACRETCPEDEAIEIVGLDRAAPHSLERLLEHRAHRIDRQLGIAGIREREVGHPDRRAFVVDAIRTLQHDAHAHVLEHRQAVRQRDRRAGVVSLEAHGPAGASGGV